MKLDGVEFLWSSDEINKRAHEYWPIVMDIERKSYCNRCVLKNGPPLHLGSELCWSKELQVFSPFSGDSRACTLSVMIRGRRSRPLMMRRTTGSSLQESCLLTATGRDNRELEAWFCLQKSFNTSSFSSSCQLEEIE